VGRTKPGPTVVLKSFTVRIPDKTIRRLKIRAIRERTSVQELVARVLEAYLKQCGERGERGSESR
jgi:predicted HicB family RNase H-like nuclease